MTQGLSRKLPVWLLCRDAQGGKYVFTEPQKGVLHAGAIARKGEDGLPARAQNSLASGDTLASTEEGERSEQTLTRGDVRDEDHLARLKAQLKTLSDPRAVHQKKLLHAIAESHHRDDESSEQILANLKDKLFRAGNQFPLAVTKEDVEQEKQMLAIAKEVSV